MSDNNQEFVLNEDEFLTSLVECFVDGSLETGSRFYGKLVSFNEKHLLIESTDHRQILIRRKMIARIEAVA